MAAVKNFKILFLTFVVLGALSMSGSFNSDHIDAGFIHNHCKVKVSFVVSDILHSFSGTISTTETFSATVF